ncbi:MAG: SH3 domain-containing protein [Rhodospirillales bacterium]|nr:MAG: SH3 domain-containing protein [Rhodospirillales bacterium]
MIRKPTRAMVRTGLLISLIVATLASLPATAGERPVPRFVSIKADEVNVRVGPGKQYPLKWTFVVAGVPVEIIAEWDNWRKIRDWEGQEGWVHSALLSSRRTVIVTGDKRILYRRADETSPPVVRLRPGIIATVEDCVEGWCRVEVRNYRGWLRRGDFWGVYPDEMIE